MGLLLLESRVDRSLDPPNITMTCTWAYEGVRAHSAVILAPHLLHDHSFWDRMETEVARWFVTRKRKHGEVCNILNVGSAQRGEGGTTTKQERS